MFIDFNNAKKNSVVIDCFLSLLLTLTFFVLPINSNAQVIDDSTNDFIYNPFVENKDFPYPTDRIYLSSVSSIILRPTTFQGIHFKDYTLHPERSNLSIFANKNHVPIAFYGTASKQAPLVFFFPGLGANASTPSSLYMAELIRKKGYNVIVMSSTMSWQFAIAASTTGSPGYGPQDAKDMYQLMKLAYRDFLKSYNATPSKIYLIGQSLGASDASFAFNENLIQKNFLIEKLILINPAFNPEQSLLKLDELLLYGQNYSEEHKRALQDYSMGLINDLISKKVEDHNIPSLLLSIKLSEKQIAWLIGMRFRDSLSDLILASQSINNLGIIKTPLTMRNISTAKKEASKLSFKDYYQFIVLKNSTLVDYMNKNSNTIEPITTEEFEKSINDTSDLYTLFTHWSSNDSLFNSKFQWAIYENQNDFLWNDEIKKLLLENKKQNSHSKIYPMGGHLGTLWVPEFQKNLFDFLAL